MQRTFGNSSELLYKRKSTILNLGYPQGISVIGVKFFAVLYKLGSYCIERQLTYQFEWMRKNFGIIWKLCEYNYFEKIKLQITRLNWAFFIIKWVKQELTSFVKKCKAQHKKKLVQKVLNTSNSNLIFILENKSVCQKHWSIAGGDK